MVNRTRVEGGGYSNEITKNGYTRSSNNHFRVQRKSSTRTPPGRPLIGRTIVVPGSGSKQSGCTRCAELMFRSTRYWLPLYPDLVRSVQATRRRAQTRTRARVHTRTSELTQDQPPGYGSPPHVKYSDILEHTTNPQDTDLRVHTRHDELLYVVVDNQIPHTYGAFSHNMRLAAKCAALLFENIGIFDVRRTSVS